MKKLYTLLGLVITLITFAQAPQGFNYQATVRNSAGALIINQNVNFQFTIMMNSATSLPLFSETHMAPTDDLGQVNLVIGQGTATVGSFSTINWANGNYYLGIELNTGNGYVVMGTTQLLSVPYALYANSAGNTQTATPNLASVLAVNNNANNLQIKNLADPTEAQDAVNKAYTDALFNSQSLMNFNGWDNNQIWNDNTIFQLQPNSFLFVNADNTTLIFPDGPENCCFGDVIYIYVMQEGSNPLNFVLQPNNFPIKTPDGWSSTDSFQGSLQAGLNTIINVGNYWMVASFDGNLNDNDNDNDGYSENQGDCDDTNSNIYPGAIEIVDGFDNNCDGLIDVPGNLGLVGDTINNWGATPDISLIYQGNGIFENTVTLSAGSFKIRQNNEWANNWGDDGSFSGVLVANGDNIPIGTGTYTISINWFEMTYTITIN